MARETVTGELTAFDWEPRGDLRPVLVFTPVSGIGFNSSKGIFFPVPIEAYPSGSAGAWSVQLESSATQRDPDFHYDLTCKWLNGAGVPVGWAQSHYSVYVPIGGGQIGNIIKAPLIRGQIWLSYDGKIPETAMTGDLIFFVPTNQLHIKN